MGLVESFKAVPVTSPTFHSHNANEGRPSSLIIRSFCSMADDALLRSSLIWLAAVVVAVGFYTHSFKKMAVTYFMGMLAIAGLLLPDWDFFDRPFSQWLSPVSVDPVDSKPPNTSASKRFRIYPLRLVIYAGVYGFAGYKWWMYVSN